MHASDMAEEYPVTSLDCDALEAVRLLATQRLPGLVVIDGSGCPHTVLAASQVVRFLVPSYVQDCPALARVIDERFADRACDKLAGHTVRDLLPHKPPELASVESDDTVIEVAATMARTRCPLVAVLDGKTVVGVVTASRLLELALTVPADAA